MTHEETFNTFIAELSEPWRQEVKKAAQNNPIVANFYNGMQFGAFEVCYLEPSRRLGNQIPLSAFKELNKHLIQAFVSHIPIKTISLCDELQRSVDEQTRKLDDYEASFDFVELPNAAQKNYHFKITAKVKETIGYQEYGEYTSDELALLLFQTQTLHEGQYQILFNTFFWGLVTRLNEAKMNGQTEKHAKLQKLFNDLCTADKNQKFIRDLFEASERYLRSVDYFAKRAELIAERDRTLSVLSSLSDGERKLITEFKYEDCTYKIDINK